MKQIKQPYEVYKAHQIEANARKLDWVWTRERSIRKACGAILAHVVPTLGVCHGARNGQELRWFEEFLGCVMIGTDIAPTAEQFSGMMQHDFHEPLDVSASFVYSNSLDHAYDPRKALREWCRQGEVVVLEWGKGHTKLSDTDPFAATLDEYIELCSEFGAVEVVPVKRNGRTLLIITPVAERLQSC